MSLSDLNTGKAFRIPEEKLHECVMWPMGKFTSAEIRKILNDTRRFIDCDQTIFLNIQRPETDPPTPVLNRTLRGKPLEDFLREEPFVVHTWGTFAVPLFTEWLPATFPKPLLIIGVPAFRFKNAEGEHDLGKNFASLGITKGMIIDDMEPEAIHAPGCIILPPND